MKRVAVFGNAGAGKSTLARQLAALTGLPLYVLDVIPYPDGCYSPGEPDGGQLSESDFNKLHADIIRQDEWIIDGYGSVALAWDRFEAADTLLYVDPALPVLYASVAERFVKGLFRNPPGWPTNSPLWSSTLDSFRVVGRCHRLLTPKYRDLIASEKGR